MPRLADHVAGAVIKEDAYGPRITKEHSTSKRHIDLAVAAVMAHDVVATAPAPKESVYETRGLMFV